MDQPHGITAALRCVGHRIKKVAGPQPIAGLDETERVACRQAAELLLQARSGSATPDSDAENGTAEPAASSPAEAHVPDGRGP